MSCHSDKEDELIPGPRIEVPVAWHSSTRGAFLTTYDELNPRIYIVPSEGMTDTLTSQFITIQDVYINSCPAPGYIADYMMWKSANPEYSEEHYISLYDDNSYCPVPSKYESDSLYVELLDYKTIAVKVKENDTDKPRLFNIKIHDASRFNNYYHHTIFYYSQQPRKPVD